MSKKFLIIFGIGLLIVLVVAFLKFYPTGAAAVWTLSDGGKWLFPLVFVSALLDSINPCAFSILLLTIAFLVSIKSFRANILKIGGFYILGIFAVYLMIGLGLLQTLHIFNTPHFMAKVGATLLIVLGAINLINEFFPKFPLKPRLPHAAHRVMSVLVEKGSLPAAFLLGVLVGLCEFPCTGGPYLMVLGLLHDQATYFRGASYLLFYNLIFILPLVVVLFLASDENLLEKVQKWHSAEKGIMRFVGGILMVALGILIFFL